MNSASTLFCHPSFEAMEKYLHENKTAEFLLKSTDLTALIFLTRSHNYALLNQTIGLSKTVSDNIEQETKDLLSRLTGQGPRDTEQKQ